MTIDLKSVLSRSDEILYAPVGEDEAVMMSVSAGKYFGLNAVGVRIWELLDTPKSVEQLCDQIHQEFEVDRQTCVDEVVKFSSSMLDNGIVNVVASRAS